MSSRMMRWTCPTWSRNSTVTGTFHDKLQSGTIRSTQRRRCANGEPGEELSFPQGIALPIASHVVPHSTVANGNSILEMNKPIRICTLRSFEGC